MNEKIAKLIEQVEKLFDEKKYKEIVDLLPDTSLEQYNNAALYAWRARAHGPLGDTDLVFFYIEKAIAIDHLLAISYFVRGRAWAEKKEYNKAIEDYTKAINLGNKFFHTYVNRGVMWSDKKEYDKAIEDFNKAIELNEKISFVYINRGVAWFYKKEYQKAIADYTKAIALDDKSDDASYNRALAYKTIEEFEKAISHYNKLIQLAKDSKDYFFLVAQSNIKELEKKLANAWYNEIAELVIKIKKLLLFEHDCVTHYTGLSAAKAMILGKSKFRLSEGAFLNDTLHKLRDIVFSARVGVPFPS